MCEVCKGPESRLMWRIEQFVWYDRRSAWKITTICINSNKKRKLILFFIQLWEFTLDLTLKLANRKYIDRQNELIVALVSIDKLTSVQSL